MVKDENSFENSYMVNLKGIKFLSKDFNSQEFLDKTPKLNSLVIKACHSKGDNQLIKNLTDVRDYIQGNEQDLEKRDSTGQTPLIVSAQLKHNKVSNFLLHEGANINAQDKYGNTCLHHLINHHCDDGINMFIQKGADIMIKNNFGQNPLHVAATNANNNQEPDGEEPTITQMLLQKYKNVEEKDKNGHTAADLSYIYGNNHTLKLLLENGAKVPDVSKVKFDDYVSPKKRNAVAEVLEPYKKTLEYGKQSDNFHLTPKHVENHIRRRSHHISDMKVPSGRIKISIRKTMSSGFVGRLFEDEESKSNSRY